VDPDLSMYPTILNMSLCNLCNLEILFELGITVRKEVCIKIYYTRLVSLVSTVCAFYTFICI